MKRTNLVYDDPAVSSLTVRFDTLELAHEKLSIRAYVRAVADPIESGGAQFAQASDIDSQSTTTQIGGDLLTPSQKDILDQEGRVVGHHLRHGAYARLRDNGDCKANDAEVSVGIYSGGACGLYGFTEMSVTGIGSLHSREVTFTSTKKTFKVWRDTTALLEIAGEQHSVQE